MSIDEAGVHEALLAVTADLTVRPTFSGDVRRGVRIRRRRRVAFTAGGATALTLAASGIGLGVLDRLPAHHTGTNVAASAGTKFPASCKIERLPVPGDTPRSLVTGMDRSGRYIVGRTYPVNGPQFRYPLVIWDNGHPRTVSMPGEDDAFNDINTSGTAVGSSFQGPDSDIQVPYVYRGGTLTKLAVPANASADARAIGEHGVIVGARVRSKGSTDRLPVAWRAPGAPAVDLPLPAGYTGGEAVDVDDDGTIVGNIYKTPGEGVGTYGKLGEAIGYVWPARGPGHPIAMPTVDGVKATAFGVEAIRHGVVVGIARIAVGKPGDEASTRPIRYELATGRSTLMADLHGAANTNGWVAGESAAGMMLAGAGKQIPLPGLRPPPATKEVGHDIVHNLSEDGLLAGGQAQYDNDEMHFAAVVWRCS